VPGDRLLQSNPRRVQHALVDTSRRATSTHLTDMMV
jgi:hypothetical protein